MPRKSYQRNLSGLSCRVLIEYDVYLLVTLQKSNPNKSSKGIMGNRQHGGNIDAAFNFLWRQELRVWSVYASLSMMWCWKQGCQVCTFYSNCPKNLFCFIFIFLATLKIVKGLWSLEMLEPSVLGFYVEPWRF